MDMKNMVRSRLDWARQLPDRKLLSVMLHSHTCVHCEDEDDENCYGCVDGLLPWWQESVTYDQFRKDVDLNDK